MTDFSTIQLSTARVLRDNPSLRDVNSREKVWLLVKQTNPTAKFSTVERSIRKLQNEKGLYLPNVDDERYILENRYKSFFSSSSSM